ncbi:MAG: ATP-binding protein [Candidatus Marsarchaeota archaeon]|jgi:signal transduction histidine kinase|nr:ATP-binding protein [Candidatus Marsarchaeota archaeon]MCL5430688.1 ATP-binding protein [Candidatus Marsarchaeota archaeon]
MAEDIVIKRFLSELISRLSATSDYDRIASEFSSISREILGIEHLELVLPSQEKKLGKLEEYVSNTGKPYVDNQLSDYSAFPELIELKNKGFLSCAAVPFVSGGKVGSIAKFASTSQEKFSNDVLSMLSIGYSFVGSAISFRSESRKAAKLTDYFDGSFNSPVPQLIIDETGKIIKANKEATARFGLSVRGANISSIMGEPQQLRSASRKQTFRLPLRDGTQSVYTATLRPISSSLSIVSMQDDTARTMASAIVSIIPSSDWVMLAQLSSTMSITSISASKRWLGDYGADAMLGKDVSTIFPEQSRERIRNGISSLKEGGIYSASDRVSIAAQPVRADIYAMMLSGITYLFAVNTEALDYARDMKIALEDFISETTDSVMEVDELGYIKDCNISASKVLSTTKEELVGKQIKDLYADPTLLDRDFSYARNGTKIDNSYADLVIDTKDGEERILVPGTHSIRVIRDRTGAMRYFIIFKELATKRTISDLEQQLKNSTQEVKKLRSIGEQKTDFIYNIAHELRTPLTSIRGYSKLIFDGNAGELSPTQKDFLSIILSECDRLTLIITQVLDASKLESEKKVKLDIRDVSLQQMSDNPAIAGLRETAMQKGLSFEWNVDYDVPAIRVDPNRLVQVFVNLIGNAIKFTDTGGITVHAYMKSKKTLMVSVSDTGIGISEEDRHKLFRKFYQAPKKSLVTQPGSGTGLGLSITREIIHLFGGKVGLDSTLGKGSTFYFTIPVSRKPRQAQ